jgi:Intracellular proteinase inhibitor
VASAPLRSKAVSPQGWVELSSHYSSSKDIAIGRRRQPDLSFSPKTHKVIFVLPSHPYLLFALLFLACLIGKVRAADISDASSRTSQPDKFLSSPGLIKGGLFMQGSKKRFEGANELNLESYKTRLEISPAQLTLTRIRNPQPSDEITVKFTLVNGSDKGSTLYFPTSQRMDAVIRDAEGKTIYTWSEDFEFATEPGYSYVNAGERLNYQLKIPFQALRGKVPQGEATITASLVNYPEVKAVMPLEIQP